VSIGLQIGEGEVMLDIADNGVGIMPADLKRTHTHGLLGMRQRVAAHGGRFDIRRAVPKGTDIHVVMPRASAASQPGSDASSAPANTH
jgi:signal transduction histidine kinase